MNKFYQIKLKSFQKILMLKYNNRFQKNKKKHSKFNKILMNFKKNVFLKVLIKKYWKQDKKNFYKIMKMKSKY